MKRTLFFRVLLGSALLSGMALARPANSQPDCNPRVSPCSTPPSQVIDDRPCFAGHCPPVATPPEPDCPEAVAPCIPAHPAPPPEPVHEPYHPEEYAGLFVCEEAGIPTTMFYAPEGSLPVIRWRSHYFAQSGYTPEVRCRAVSARFQRFYNAGILNYVTTGIVNRLPVVCVSSEFGGPCSGILYTLRPGQNASQVLQQLFDISYGQAGPLYESGSRLYLDMNEYLRQVQPQ